MTNQLVGHFLPANKQITSKIPSSTTATVNKKTCAADRY